jgi:hypothetical protein
VPTRSKALFVLKAQGSRRLCFTSTPKVPARFLAVTAEVVTPPRFGMTITCSKLRRATATYVSRFSRRTWGMAKMAVSMPRSLARPSALATLPPLDPISIIPPARDLLSTLSWWLSWGASSEAFPPSWRTP